MTVGEMIENDTITKNFSQSDLNKGCFESFMKKESYDEKSITLKDSNINMCHIVDKDKKYVDHDFIVIFKDSIIVGFFYIYDFLNIVYLKSLDIIACFGHDKIICINSNNFKFEEIYIG